MTVEWIYAGLLLVLALVFDLVPGAKQWWEELPKEAKRWGWIVGCTLVPIVLWWLACYAGINVFGFIYACDQDGFIRILALAWGSYVLSQGGHGLAKLSGRAY